MINRQDLYNYLDIVSDKDLLQIFSAAQKGLNRTLNLPAFQENPELNATKNLRRQLKTAATATEVTRHLIHERFAQEADDAWAGDRLAAHMDRAARQRATAEREARFHGTDPSWYGQ